jgi:DNA helicase-2/ATP-dependent DNA helicase PcrA
MEQQTILKPTDEQLAIIRASNRRVIVEANAGAAKTTTAAMWVKALLQRGVKPERICVLSFTSPGVNAFMKAFERVGVPKEVVMRLRLSTVDDLCAKLLKVCESTVPRPYKKPEDIKEHVLKAISDARERHSDQDDAPFPIEGIGEFAVESLIKEMTWLKGTMAIQTYGESFSLNQRTADELNCSYAALLVFAAYERNRCFELGSSGEVINHRYLHDATYDMARYLESDIEPWQWDLHPMEMSLHSLVVDEMHDCNRAMFRVIKHLLDRNPNASMLGVGDRDQVIHSQHGSDSAFMGETFRREIGAYEKYPLTLSMRSGGSIATPMERMTNKEYKYKSSLTTDVRLRESTGVKETVDELMMLSTRSASDFDKSTVALLRKPAAAVELEHELLIRGVRYRTSGFETFVRRPEIAFMRFLLAIAINEKTMMLSQSLETAKSATWAFMGPARFSLDTIEESYQVLQRSSEETARQYHIKEMIKQSKDAKLFLTAIDIAKSNKVDDLPRIVKTLKFSSLGYRLYVTRRDVDSLESSIEGFVKIANNYQSIESFLGALNKIDHMQSKYASTQDSLTLSSIEAAKGLEFGSVMLVDADEDAFDLSTEEQNLFYVAVTRAKNSLVLNYKKGRPVRFLSHFSGFAA